MIRKVLFLLAVFVGEQASSQSFWQLMPNTPPLAGVFYDLFFDRRGDAFLSFGYVGPHRSVNYGGTWVPASGGLPQNDVSKFTSPALDVHLAGLHRGQFPTGIFRTTDAGSNWTMSGLNTRSVSHVEWFTGQTVFAIADGVTLYRSTNSGTTWDSVLAGGTVGGGEFTAFVTNRIGASVFAASNARGVFRSTDNGTTWSRANGGLLDSLAIAAMAVDSTGGIYAAVGFPSNFPGRVYRSTNNGASWTLVGNIGFAAEQLFCNALGHLFGLAVESGIKRSTNGGVSWGTLNSGFGDSSFVNGGTISPGGYVYLGTIIGRLYRSIQPTAPPTIPVLLLPPNNSIHALQTVQFFWTKYENGLVHHLQVANNPAFTQTSLLYNDSTLSSPGQIVSSLPRAQLLYWRVRVRNSLGWGNVSPAWTFAIQPASPQLLSPADSATNQPVTPTLSWENLGASITYHLQVSTSTSFTTLVVNDSTLTATQRQVGPLNANTTYFWRVRVANSPGGPGPYSTSRRFTTAAPPPAPTLLSPPDSAVNQPTTLTLSWSNLGAQVTYHLQVSTTSTFTTLVVNDSTLTATQRQVGPLSHFTTFFWRVRASNSPGGPSAFSPARRFTTVGVPVVSLLPSSLSYRVVQLGSRINALLRVVNIGTAPLGVDSIRLAGAHPSEFTIVGSTGPFPPIALLDTLRIVVQCVPQTVGAKSAFVRIFSNASSSPDTIRLSADVIPSQVQVNVGQAKLEDSLRVRVTVQQGFRPVLSQIFFRNGGQQTYRSTSLAQRGDTLLVTLPPSVLNIRGVEYYVLLFDSANNMLSFPAGDYINNPALVRVSVQSLLFPHMLQGLRYRMISIPLDLEQQDILAVLGDDFGSYDRAQWRIFRWNLNAYAEFDQIPSPFFRPGVAYWLITRSGGSFDVENALSVVSGQPYTILLQPGWNQIATPFAFPVEWQAIGNSQLVRAPFRFDGDQFVPNATILQPWEGYFVFNDSTAAIPLVVPPVEASVVGSKNAVQALPGGSYILQLSASSGTLSDAYNYLGFRSDATTGDDRLDLIEPPPVGDYLQLSIVEGERAYAANFKPLAGDGEQWRLRLSTTLPHQTVRVTLHKEGRIPPGFRLFVLDEDERAAISVHDESFSIQLREANSSRTLRVIIGTEIYAQQARNGIPLEPIAYALHQNYPNPFSAKGGSGSGGNPATTIRYALKKRSDVRVEIFNLLGQTVRVLARGEQGAGSYDVVWDGRDNAGTPVASGVYMVQLQAAEFRASRKIMLIR